MERKKLRRKSKSGLKKETGRWRPTTRQVFWAIGMVATLMTIALLLVHLYPGLWEDVSTEPVAMLKGRVATLIGIGVGLTVLIVLLAMGSASLGWTGFRGKTLWDLLQLLIVPLVLVGIGFLFEMQQTEREERRAEVEREIEEQRAQDEALQAYLDEMSTLLIEHDLRDSDNDTTRSAAKARTLAVLSRLDGDRKYSLLLFLVETDLVQDQVQDQKDASGGIVPLVGADLSNLEVESRSNLGWNLSKTNLDGTDLSDADLHNVVMRETNLSNTDLSGANLSEADLTGVTLINAILSNADLSGTTGWTEQQLTAAESLEGATMPDGQVLKGDDNPDGPTFEEWLMSKNREEWLKSKNREEGGKTDGSP